MNDFFYFWYVNKTYFMTEKFASKNLEAKNIIILSRYIISKILIG